MWSVLKMRESSTTYVAMIKYMFDRSVTRVTTIGGKTKLFSITISFHKGSYGGLNHYLFALVMDKVIKHIHDEVL